MQIPYSGWQVAELTARDVWELWTLRGSLEGLAPKLAAQSTDPAVRQHIEKAYVQLMAACADGDAAPTMQPMLRPSLDFDGMVL